jgi:hypothetical protein
MKISSKTYFSLLWTFLVLFISIYPAVDKIEHALFEHVSLDCDDGNDTHIHTKEQHCSFQDFQQTNFTNHYLSDYIHYHPLIEEQASNIIGSVYKPSYHPYFGLRAPPSYS